MAPLHCIDLTPQEKTRLLDIARRSIVHGLATDRPLDVDRRELSGALAESHGNFVTLTQQGMLRGCVGRIEVPRDHLAQSVAVNAFHAAVRDTRFRALSATEAEHTRIEISVLSRPEPIEIDSMQELLATLCPHEDGLIVEYKTHLATFLPKVWEKVAGPEAFVGQLMAKAGLPAGFWSDTIRFRRYRTLSFAESTEAVSA